MAWRPPESLDPAEWRRRAEELVGPVEPADLREGETARVVHELRVHQLELEMQNEALGEARMVAEAGWERFQELYDSAPAGFFSVDRQGAILELNLAAARLLGTERALLANGRFGQFLGEADQAVFAAFLSSALASGAPPCEVLLPASGPPGTRVRLHSATADGKVLQLAAIEIGAGEDREPLRETVARELGGIAQDIEGACRKLRELAERLKS